MPQATVSTVSEDSRSEDEADILQDYQQSREAPSPPPMNSTLRDAINTATLTELRRLLVKITDDNMDARDEAMNALLIPIASSGGKRKRSEKCRNCGEDYRVEENLLKCCKFHEGEKTVDEVADLWVDHDSDGHGSFEDFEDDPEYAEGFVWKCCGQRGDAEGCIVSRHEPQLDASAKRDRI